MIFKVMYGIDDIVYFDTETKEIFYGYTGGNYIFIEAKRKRDIKELRESLIANGYTEKIII